MQSQQFNYKLKESMDKVKAEVPNRKGLVWPLWHVNLKGDARQTTGLVRSQDMIQITLPYERKGLLPSVFQSAEDRQSFFSSRPDAPKEYFPLFSEMLAGVNLPPDSLYYMAAEANVSVPKMGERARLIAILRDDRAPRFPNCFQCPGGQMDVAPFNGGLAQFNQEIAIIQKEANQHYILNMGQEGLFSTLTKEQNNEKRAQIPLALQRIKAAYGEVFGDLQPEDVKVKELYLEANPAWRQYTSLVVVQDHDSNQKQGHVTAIHYPAKRAIGLQTHLLMPFGLEQGENFFPVDVQFKRFARDVYALSVEEVVLAKRSNALIDEVVHSQAKLLEQEGQKPAQYIKKITSQGPVRQQFIDGKLQDIGPAPK